MSQINGAAHGSPWPNAFVQISIAEEAITDMSKRRLAIQTDKKLSSVSQNRAPYTR
jgi:hypothetical protein